MNLSDNTLPFAQWNKNLQQLDLFFEPHHKALFYSMKPAPLPSFTRRLLEDIDSFQRSLQDFLTPGRAQNDAVKFTVHCSSAPGIFNLGGDLGFFVDCIRNGDREAISDYARLSIDVLHRNYVNLERDITSIALLEGTTIGAAFEAALSSDVIIAVRGIELGFPEVLFNMFPGMGAYSFLARRLPPARVEHMIMSGEMYSSEQLHEEGVIDLLVEPGEARSALDRFMSRHAKTEVTRRAVMAMRDRVNPVSYEELLDIAMIWVDAAMQLPDKSLRVMDRLVKAQGRRVEGGRREEQAV